MKKFYVHEIAAVDLSKIYFLKNATKTFKPNNCDFKSRLNNVICPFHTARFGKEWRGPDFVSIQTIRVNQIVA